MNGLKWPIILFGIMAFSIIIPIVIILLKEAKIAKFQRRFRPFSLAPIHNTDQSLFDKILLFFWNTTKNGSKFLEKSHFFRQQSLKYEKFIPFEEKEHKNKIDYITIKIEIAGFLFLCCFVSFLIHDSSMKIVETCISILVGYYLPDIFLNFKYLQKRKQIEEDLLKAIIIMNHCFKSGRNIMQAIEIVKNELNGPIRDEFQKIHMDMTYGLSIDVVFQRFYERVKLEDAKYITSTLTLLNKTGGNIVNVFSSIEKSIFNKKKLQNEMKSLTASSIFVFRILVLLPILFVAGILLMNQNYFAPFFKTPYGFLLLLFIIMLYLFYIFTIKKVLKVKIS